MSRCAIPRTRAELDAHLDHIRAAPRDRGTLSLIVARPKPGKRALLDEALISLDTGLAGDSWATRKDRWGKPPDLRKQITLTCARMVAALSDDPAERALAGDSLFVDLDLAVPPGARIAIGADVVVEVTKPPHRGCKKFTRYFGEDATAWVNAHDLRGVNARVVTGGTVKIGDVVSRLP